LGRQFGVAGRCGEKQLGWAETGSRTNKTVFTYQVGNADGFQLMKRAALSGSNMNTGGEQQEEAVDQHGVVMLLLGLQCPEGAAAEGWKCGLGQLAGVTRVGHWLGGGLDQWSVRVGQPTSCVDAAEPHRKPLQQINLPAGGSTRAINSDGNGFIFTPYEIYVRFQPLCCSSLLAKSVSVFVEAVCIPIWPQMCTIATQLPPLRAPSRAAKKLPASQ
jgi:hypothetical protein